MKHWYIFPGLSLVALAGAFLAFPFFIDSFRDKSEVSSHLKNSEGAVSARRAEADRPATSIQKGSDQKKDSFDDSRPILNRETMAWVYPGDPACSAPTEYSDGRVLDVLKPEYFSVNENGDLIFLTEESHGCNAYSSENAEKIRKFSKEQFVTVSSSYSKSTDVFMRRALRDGKDIARLVDFVRANNFTGAELDFEDFGGWDSEIYDRYREFVKRLGEELHSEGKKLVIDGPAIPGNEEVSWYRWRYEDFVSLPVDRIVVMAYDYQFDHGAGSPIAPFLWMEKVLRRTVSKFPDVSRLSVGIPSYGYEGVRGSSQVTILTYDQMKEKQGFETATRDSSSGEMTWTSGNRIYFYQDGKSMDQKRALIEKFGIFSVSVWHLGGNQWFAGE